MIYGIEKFKHNLFQEFLGQRTDSKTLRYRPNIKLFTGIKARWIEYLTGFDFKVEQVPGKDNVITDAI